MRSRTWPDQNEGVWCLLGGGSVKGRAASPVTTYEQDKKKAGTSAGAELWAGPDSRASQETDIECPARKRQKDIK